MTELLSTSPASAVAAAERAGFELAQQMLARGAAELIGESE
jgi:hypothetical protein